MREVVIVEAVRTPMGRRNGVLSGIHPNDLGAKVLNELIKRSGIEAEQVEDVVFGCVDQVGEQGANVARNVLLTADFPYTVPATSVDRQCGSGQQAVHFAANLIQAGVCDITIGGGVESMSRVPLGVNIMQGPGAPFQPSMMEKYPLTPQGISAEEIAVKWGVKRQEADEFALNSQEKAKNARDEGRFDREMLQIDVKLEGLDHTVKTDEGIRESSLEKLGSLQPSFRPDGIHHAGNSSQITDGSSAILLMSREKAEELGKKPRARIVGQAVVGSDPVLMLTGPITATPKVLKHAGLELKDIDLIEINEAFASVVLAWKREVEPDMSKVNVNGGAIALGHPLGATGARLMTTMLHELERTGGRYGMQVMCCGGGLGTATIIERLD
ncbi:MAG: thiolase family protein [Chloroflexi bacterium]|nr:thiolase family protein [Chloroflexota bacterium]MCI0783062.1 thiolase family protein [Chloroflexota bacterium]MCI0816804.1 thiolase family protein [Chloroflexota bacterium]MCI0819002.1 thiolase family protein [Chloroflexota bacterium]MCI0831781.1 thiolase family protein [Chloroflexota bacterium]